jgi:hypothetical protein
MATSSHSGRAINGASDHGEAEHKNLSNMDNSPFEETLVGVWLQALVENAEVVVLGTSDALKTQLGLTRT